MLNIAIDKIKTGNITVIEMSVTGVVAFIILLFILKKNRPKNAPPTAKVGLPIIGNFMKFAENPVKFIEICMHKYGCIYTVPMMHKNLTFLLGPEVSAPFFNLHDDAMSQPEVYGFMTPVFGKGVVYDAPADKRNKQYQGMAQGLKTEAIKSYVPKIEKETLEYLKKWGDSGEVDILEALSELTILTSSRCLHGDDVREELYDDIARIYYDLDKGVTPISFFFPNAPTAAHKMRDDARKEMVAIFGKVIEKRRAKQQAGQVLEGTDILQVFVDLKYKDGSTLSVDEVVGLLIALLFAGQHTSSITSTWTTMFLIHHLKCLDQVVEEQKSILNGNMKANLTFEHVSKMNYLENCVKEALRMHPPLIMLMRMAMKDIKTTLNGKEYVIPKGDIVVTSPAVSSRLGDVFKDPDQYQPDRFGAERKEQDRQYAFLGFGGGIHACKGAAFGLLQVKTIMSVLLRNFKIEATEAAFPEPDYTAMVVGPKNHCKVRYSKLESSII